MSVDQSFSPLRGSEPTAIGLVVNCKVKYIRPQYNDLEEWTKDDNNVYIGRGGVVFVKGKRFPPKASIFCNPFIIDKDGNREEVLIKYEEYIRERLKAGNDPIFKEELMKLKGKNLGCWCKPEKCHGDILLKFIR
jgi:hypothetical protein